MKTKKNSKVDVAKKSILFFQIGLVLVLFAVWQALEMKTYAKNDNPQDFSTENPFLAETIMPVIILPTPEIPKKNKVKNIPVVKNPDKLEVITDDSDIEPLIMDFVKPTEPIVTILDIPNIEKPEIIDEISYIVVESVPVFPGCEGLDSNEEKQKCMEGKIKKIVNKNFDRNIAQDLGLEGTNRIQVLFKIDYQGNVVDVQAKSGQPLLNKEAQRVVHLFPKMKPGKQRGVPVNVSYSFPIIFNVK